MRLGIGFWLRGGSAAPNPTEPTEPTDPTEPTYPTEPTDPTDQTDPTDPTETIENPTLGLLTEGDRLGDRVIWGSDV